MRRYVPVIAIPFLFAAFCGLSWLAIYGFWLGVWFFDSVPAARLCDAIGRFILLPARLFLWVTTGFDNPTTPLFAPTWYIAINGALLTLAAYLGLRPLLLRSSETSARDKRATASGARDSS